ncbi:hypothetical protein [Mycoplasmopsis sturni]|uniref:hypothetical protein n=1 Tax=Mycoplasmopsis sturni TaxID=39047 RepID=UPI00056A1889|nr:hypothetical protein [Mycoplasmopsis sturni]
MKKRYSKIIKAAFISSPIVASSILAISCTSSNSDTEFKSNSGNFKNELLSIGDFYAIEPVTLFNLYEKFKPELNSKVTKDLKVTLSDELLPKKEDITGYPEKINVKIDGDNFELRVSQTSSYLELGEYGQWFSYDQKEKAEEKYKEIENVKEIPFGVSVSYSLFYNNKKIEGDSLTFTKTFKTQMPETLGQAIDEVKPNPEEFVSTNIDWSNVNYVEAKVVSVSDGDTFRIVVTEGKWNDKIPVGTEYTVRLNSIDTPEKAVGKAPDTKFASPFEHSFALMSTTFAERLWNINGQVKNGLNKNYANKVRVLTDVVESYGRIVTDVFFGPNFEYSYSNEIVRAGYTYPYETDKNNWQLGLESIKSDKSEPIAFELLYKQKVYPLIWNSFNQAIKEKRGFFKFFDNPIVGSRNIYLIKPNTSWDIFWKDTDPTKAVKVSDVKNVDKVSA